MNRAMMRLVAASLVQMASVGVNNDVHADALISDFDNFNLDFSYASWDPSADPAPIFISAAMQFTVQASDFGGGGSDISPDIDASVGNETHVELDVTVDSGADPNILVLLSDDDLTEYLYRWDSVSPGNHRLSFPIETITGGVRIDGVDSFVGNPGGDGSLDVSTLSFFHLQVDPHGAVTPYDIAFNNLRLKSIPGGFDTDEDRDGADFVLWQRGLTPESGSADELAQWESNFGAIGEVAAVAVTNAHFHAIPEPGATGLMVLAGAVIFAANMQFERRR